jgi:hypothetical protein
MSINKEEFRLKFSVKNSLFARIKKQGAPLAGRALSKI